MKYLSKTIPKFIFSGLSVILLLLISSFGSPLQDDSLHLEAKVLYSDYCAACHGVQLQAFVDRKWLYGTSTNDLFKSISVGRVNSEEEMPDFGETLSEKEIRSLVNYIIYAREHVTEYVFEAFASEADTFWCEDFAFRLEPVNIDTEIPWGMAFLPDGSMLVTDREGGMNRIIDGNAPVTISGVPAVLSKGQGGLLDIELHPNFSENQWLYLSYSKYKRKVLKIVSTTAVSRYRLKGNTLVEGKLIFEAFPYSGTDHHYGSRLEFDNDGYLYISVGERGARDVNPQNLSSYPGKIHRLTDDGGIPADNPFASQQNAIQSIYSFGHRNPQGMAKHPKTGEIWTHEHGPRGGDEINIIRKGANYGWPVVSYGIDYNGTIFTSLTEKEGIEPPLHYWTPSIAPSGMEFVQGNRYPGWEGHLLIGSLRFQYLHLSHIEGNKVVAEEKLLKNIGRVRNVKQAPNGYIYVAVEDPGRIYRVVSIK